MDYRYIVLNKEDHIATLTFNRPERLNALVQSMIVEIATAIQEVSRDNSIWVLIVTGAGKAFCAGGDFKDEPGSIASDSTELSQHPSDVARLDRFYGRGVSLGLQNLRIPTIAMVNGASVGAGFDFALACDMRMGCENSRFRVAWTARGLTTAFGTTWFLPRLVGIGKAAELIFTARIVEAQEALELGLLNKLVSANNLKNETMALAEQIAKNPPLALQESKLNLYRGLDLELGAALDFLASSQAQLMTTEDFVESTRAFQEKRMPLFRGR
jgi:2-(1,2-epoxy-1,2-dihydrophenyl)acetyl-CoA isomerase